MNLVSAIYRNALHLPDTPALVEDGTTLTYAGLLGRIEAAAFHLREHGVRPGDTVFVAVQSGLLNVVTMFALFRLGAVACNADWRSRPAEMAAYAAALRPRLAVVDRAPKDIGQVRVAQVTPAWESSPGKLPDPAPADPDAPAILLLSSGTTGRPKAVRVSHRAAMWRGLLRVHENAMGPGHRVLMPIPMTATSAIHSLLGQLLAGATTYHFPVIYSPEELLDALRRLRIEQTTVVPTVARWMLDLPWQGRPLLPDISAFRVTGAAFQPQEKSAVMQRITPNLYEAYGSAGAGFITLATPRDIAARPDSVGMPSTSVDVEVLDPQGRLLPVGEVGRIRVRSIGVASGYAGDSGAHEREEVFQEDGYYPGDLGRFDEDGYLYLEGRAASVIIRGGQNVYPEEIERVLADHGAVSDAAVVGFPDTMRGEIPVALVVRRAPIEERDLLVHCRGLLQSHKRPARIVFVETLPRNAMGKIVRTELAALVPKDVP